MNKLLKAANKSLRTFAREDDGAQVVEYALIIAVVSIALVLGLKVLASGNTFTNFIARVNTCLTGTCV